MQSTWAGVEPLLDPSLRRDYVLTNARGVFGGLMSEYVFAYMLAHERKLLDKYASQAAGPWDPAPPGTLRGKTLGLLGVGTIGAALARTAKHFGMRVKGYTRAQRGQRRTSTRTFTATTSRRSPRDLDYLVGVMPATARTRRSGERRRFSARCRRARSSSIPGRGGVVDEPALADALQTDRLAGAVLDVFAAASRCRRTTSSGGRRAC